MRALPSREELRALAPVPRGEIPPAALAVSLVIPARAASHSLAQAASEAHRHLQARYGDDFEILIASRAGGDAETAALAAELGRQLPRLRVVSHSGPPGKGANLRAGFLASRGRRIFFTDADLPYDLSFLDDAAQCFTRGYDFVTGNRRLPSSVFRVSVSLLRLAYGRHRLGLWFNWAVRKLLPIRTTDTQAGIKGMTREFAIEAFTRQRCPGFFFDLELFLTARALSFQWIELPVILHLNSEKSTVRIVRESLAAAFWLGSIARAERRGVYGGARTPGTPSIPARFARGGSLEWATRAFLRARWTLTPYTRIAAELPPVGDILDLGCGHGLLALTAALSSTKRRVLGIDHDPRRVDLAKRASADIANLKFERGRIPELPPGRRFSAVALIDVMHYFDERTQLDIITRARDALEPGGRLLVREVDPDGGLVAHWNRLYETIATKSGITKSADVGLHFRSRRSWTALFAGAGFEVSSAPCTSPLFSDVLFICQKNSQEEGLSDDEA